MRFVRWFAIPMMMFVLAITATPQAQVGQAPQAGPAHVVPLARL